MAALSFPCITTLDLIYTMGLSSTDFAHVLSTYLPDAVRCLPAIASQRTALSFFQDPNALY